MNDVTVLPTAAAEPVDQADDDTVSSVDLVREAGITYRQLDYWTRVGLLTPTGDITPGTGYSRRYEPDQIPLAIATRQLIAAGLNLRAAHEAALQLTTGDGEAQLGPYTLIHTGEPV